MDDFPTYDRVPAANTRFYELLLQVRPSQLADALKTCLRIRRQHVLTRTGHKFCVDPVSVFGIHLLRDGIHEPQMTRLLHALLRPSDTFLDVGGNEGYFSVMASTLLPEGTVHCIEPQSRLPPVLKTNFELNRSATVFLHQTALSDREAGTIRIYLRPSTNTGASGMFRYWRLGSKAETVPGTTLDSWFERYGLERVRLMKVDCEGAESLVVAGGRKVLEGRRIDFIAMEYHPSICGAARCKATHSALTDAGYCVSKPGGQSIYHLPGFESELKGIGDVIAGALPDD